MIKEALDSPKVTIAHMKSLVGKIIYIRFLVPGGKFRMGYLTKAAAWGGNTKDTSQTMQLSRECKEHLHWWFVMLRIHAGGSPIVRPDLPLSPLAIPAYTDAAGGSWKIGHGLGGVIPPKAWFYVPWPRWLNEGKSNSDGVKFDRKLCVLEMLGPLAILTIRPNMVRNKDLEVFVDNSGAVNIFAKGYSSGCVYSYTVAMAINDVATALNCNIQLTKITRCSDTFSVVADAISKADFRTLDKLMETKDREPSRVPRTLLQWINDPKEDTGLGRRILMEMAQYTMVLGYNC